MLRQLPNALTASRLLLVAPLGLLILEEQYHWALCIGLVAGITDALDGFFARRLGAFSRLGAILDPVADKLLVTVAFLCLARVGLVSWPLAILVVTRDLVIVSGALCYHFLIGALDMAPLQLSKWNMAVQIIFCTLVLLGAWAGVSAPAAHYWGELLVAAFAIVTGAGYVLIWSRKAIINRRSVS